MSFLSSLATIVGCDAVITEAATLPYRTDQRGRYVGEAVAVVFPQDTQQVAKIVELCATEQIAIVPQGGNTSLCGGSVPALDVTTPQLIVNLSRMQKIRAIDTVDYTITVEAGCTLQQVRDIAKQHNRLFPLGLTAIQHKCEIGGNLASNAGGIGVLRYGNARDLVLGLEVVLPDGQIWNGLRSLRKDNSGYDLKHLFLGSEGTLGIITAAVLKLVPRPQASATACIAVPDVATAVQLLSHVRAFCGDILSGFELMSRSCLELVFKHIPNTTEPFSKAYPYYVLIQQENVLARPLSDALHAALSSFTPTLPAFDVTDDETHAESWWLLRKSINEAQKREGFSVKHDISVPVSQVATFLAQADSQLLAHYPDIRIVAFGHMGDGNIHYNMSMPDAEENKRFIESEEGNVNQLVYRVLQNFRGSISAEHGLGQLKREAIRDYKQPLELELMKKIKQTLDPQGLFNPNKVL